MDQKKLMNCITNIVRCGALDRADRNIRCLIIFVVFIMICLSFSESAAEEQVYILDLRNDCLAKGDSKTDDSLALLNCLNRLVNHNGKTRLIIPDGVFKVNTAVQFPIMNWDTQILGTGVHLSSIILGQNFSGSVFSWHETWIGGSFSKNTVDTTRDLSGSSVSGIRIVGTRDAVGRQAALTFYDRNDFVTIRDVEMDYINGPCISIGHTLRMPQAYMRESAFYNVKCWNSGSDTEPAVEIGSTTEENSDATNELDFYKLAIFAAKNVGLAIRNPNPHSATRKLRFFGLRVENSGGDDIQIAPAPDKGQVAELGFYDLSALTAGGAALRVGNPAGKPPYAIGVHGGLFGPGNKTGIEIDSGRLIDIELSALDAPVVLGAGAGADITVHGNGSEYDWRFEGTKRPGEEAVPLNLRAPYGLYGLPNAGARVGAAALKGRTSDGRPVRLTMDGKEASAYNCFNPGYAQAFNLDIQLMAVDRAAPDRFYAWRMPLAVLSAWTGAGSAKFSPGEASGRGVAGASVEVGPDMHAGCLSLVFSPPQGDWDVTAAVHFARAP